MLLHFTCFVHKKSNLVCESRPCNTLPQHYVMILFNMDVCVLKNKYYLKLGKLRRKQNA